MSFYEFCFSPTGGTKKAADLLAEGLSEEVIPVDLTDAGRDFAEIELTEKDTAILAVPSYGGRVPETAVRRIVSLCGNQARAVLVCAYGNRAYEDTLVELKDTAELAGFRVIAAVAAIAEHSIDREFAAGRPDAQDRAALAGFAGQIRKKLAIGADTVPKLPGNHPYKKGGRSGLTPKTGKDCTKCGICAKVCPVLAIDKKDPAKTDGGLCISCMRCISVCPRDARRLSRPLLFAVHEMLKKTSTDRKEAELYL